MKKTISKLLVIVNILVVVFLLIASMIMLSMTGTAQNELFGYQAKFVAGDNTNGEIGEKCFVLLQPNSIPKIYKGCHLLYTQSHISYIITVIDKNDNTIFYIDAAGETQSFDITAAEYEGIVAFSSNFLGNLFFDFAKNGTISLQFILIGGIFIISLLVLLIIYAVYLRKRQTSGTPATAHQYQEKMQLFDDRQSIEAEPDEGFHFQAEGLITSVASPCPEPEPELVVEMIFVSEEPPQLEKTVQILAQIEKCESFFALQPKPGEVPTPPFDWAEDDVPSIDSLMELMDRQFKELDDDPNAQDDDTKRFTFFNNTKY